MPTNSLIILRDLEAIERATPGGVTRLTEEATRATFYRDDLTEEQRAANARIVSISAGACLAAAKNENQQFSAAFVDGAFAGYVIATRHAGGDLELDWLMVSPAFHGSGVAAALMEAGLDWLGRSNPVWLNVIAYNARAIGFYRKFGFEVDTAATTHHAVPHAIMRRRPDSV